MPGFQSLPLKNVFGLSEPIGEMHKNFTSCLQICLSLLLYLLKNRHLHKLYPKITKALTVVRLVA
jgi:hypothetical protein